MDICLINIYEIPESWFWKRNGYFMAGALKQTIISGVVKS